MDRFKLSQIQAQAILDLTLRRLTSLERGKIEAEHKEILANITRFREILADERELLKLIADEIEDIKKEFADPRRTQIIEGEGEFSIEDLIVEEDVLVTVTHGGYIKRTPLSLYRTQRRGGRGKIGATTSEEDFVEHLVAVSTHDRLFFFTSSGKVYALKAYELPEGGRAAKGRSIANLLSLDQGETLSAFLPLPQDLGGQMPALRDPPRAGQEDRTEPVRKRARQRDHRDPAGGRRRADRGANHRRQPGGRAFHPPGPGDPLQGGRGRGRWAAPRMGSMGWTSTRATRPARAGRGGVDGDRARGRDPAHGLRTRLRQAHRRPPNTG